MKNLKLAISHLRRNPVINSLIKTYGILDYPTPSDRFENLVESIVSQQLSPKAASTIYGRLKSVTKIAPKDILALDPQQIRDAGLAWSKVAALKDLSEKVLSNQIDLSSLDHLSDAEVITYLTQVKGIGPWTAQMKLMFVLHRPDILPLDDVGIQNAMKKLFSLASDSKKLKLQMEEIAASWRPYRTIACWYLWASLDNKL
jgi:DNA-3-methyladenine glycosylase II